MKSFNLAVILFFISGSLVKAQISGTIEKNGVSTNGQFLSNKIGDYAIFKVDGTKSFRKYFPDEIDFLELKNLKFKTIDLGKNETEPKLVIAKVLVQGKFSLYKYHDSFFFSDGYKISELVHGKRIVDGKMFEFNEYQILLKNVFSNDEAIVKQLKNIKYNSVELINIFKSYNKNNFPEEVLYVDSGKGGILKKHTVGFKIGTSNMEYLRATTGLFEPTSKAGNSYSFGYSFKLIYNWRFSSEIGIHYAKIQSTMRSDYSLGYRTLDFQNDFLEIPLTINVNLLPKGTTPRVLVALKYLSPLNKDVAYFEYPTNRDRYLSLFKGFWGYEVGLGITKNIKSGRVFLDLVGEFTLGKIIGYSPGDIMLTRKLLRLSYQF